jgi:prefoldin subunit 5
MSTLHEAANTLADLHQKKSVIAKRLKDMEDERCRLTAEHDQLHREIQVAQKTLIEIAVVPTK